MINKQKIAMKFINLQSKIAKHIVEYEDYIPDETNELLTDIVLGLDEVMRLVADLEEKDNQEDYETLKRNIEGEIHSWDGAESGWGGEASENVIHLLDKFFRNETSLNR